ncbi:MAG: hypothetical protein OXK80_00130 [Bdellovibrionales bacterium]|nr:hypothetical protein [Bdellovibrionales bacterium]
MILRFFLSLGFILLCTSCVEVLPDQFQPNDVKQDQIFPIDQIIKTKCYIKTQGPIESGSAVSQAQKIVLESNKSDSVVFPSHSTSTFPVINNLPVVEYEVRGSSLCQTVLTQREIRLVARPHTSYEVYFQITGSYLRVLMSGTLHELPYQRLAQAIRIQNDRYALPIGGYSIQQGQVRNMMNVDNKETHILDFFPNEDSLESFQSHVGIPQKIRTGAKEIYIPELSSGFSSFQYQEKPDILPKTYFEGVWYSGVSVVSAKRLSRYRQAGSGVVRSGDSYSSYTPGQKVSFQFESGRLKAINEYYKKQGDQLDYPVEAEVLSIPVKHLDYRNTLTDVSVDEDLSEPVSSHLSWEERRYVSLDFSQVDDFHRKRVRAVARRYLEDSLSAGEMLSANTSVTVKEVRFAPDYFDFVIVTSDAIEYRFSFFKKDSSKKSTYQPKTIAKTDPRFEFFRLQYNTIFSDPLHSFRADYEDRIRLMRVHPNEKGLVPIHFSNSTPQDDLIRNIGREAVSLWNQALAKAKVSWRLYLDETKNVNIGDIRYHILNITNERNKSYSGIAQFYADDETGELISTVSNVIIPDTQEFVEKLVIDYAYEAHQLLNPLRSTNVKYPSAIGKSFVYPIQQTSSLSYSVENLQYLLFKNHIQQFSNIPVVESPRSLNEVSSYFTSLSQVQDAFKKPFSEFFSNIQTPSPELRDWLKEFKITYALRQGRFMEHDSLEQIQNNVRAWGLEDKFLFDSHNSELDRNFRIICHDIENPLSNRGAFESSVRRCVQKVYPIFGLGVTVHEIGHAIFSLRHNHKASADYSYKDDTNYRLSYLVPYLTYENEKGEIARVDDRFSNDQASSCMDYLSASSGRQWAPGAYDVGGVQVLYDGALDEPEASDSNLDVFSRSSNQMVFNIINFHNEKGRNQFRRCSDWDVGSSAYCLRHDSGSKPHEIAMNEIRSLFRVMDQYFYNQDRFMSDDAFYSSIFRRFWNLMVIYQDWRRHLDQFSRSYFNTTIEYLNEDQRSELFSKFTSSIKVKNKQEKELFSFYKARNLIYHTLTYLAFLPNRYCVLEKDWSAYTQKRWKPENVRVLLELSKIISAESSLAEQQVYPILSCWQDADQDQAHPAVARYMLEHYPNYSLKKEIGHFLYPQLLPQSAPYKEASGLPYKGTYVIRTAAFMALTLTGNFFPVPMENSTPSLSMMNEIDLQKGLERLLLARITRGVFYPVTDFFDSFKERRLGELDPEDSARKLFRFPYIRAGTSDPLFRDELIQPQQLTDQYRGWPQSRTDRYGVRDFYQNFSEEKHLLNLFNNLYSVAYAISGGISNDSISERRTEISESVHVLTARTSHLLMDKVIQYNMYQEFPALSTRYYFELNDFLVFPGSDSAVDSFGNQVLSELAKNSTRLLWTKPYRKFFEGEDIYTSENFEAGFGTHLYNYLGALLSQFQNTRLGRFYFMYAYWLALGLLDGYERAISIAGLSPEEFHTQAISANTVLQSSVLQLFGFVGCDGPQVLTNFYNNLNSNTRMKLEEESEANGAYRKWVQDGTFQSTEEEFQYRQDFEQWLFEACSKDPLKKGKLHRLFIAEGEMLNRMKSFGLGNFVLGSPYVELPAPLNSLWADRLNFSEERLHNRMLIREVHNIENYLSTRKGVEGIHTAMNMLFQSAFTSFANDKLLFKEWIQSNRQVLIDVIPKLMLMYSEDRRFVGEFMFLSAVVYNHCFNNQTSLQKCRLILERFIGHYFRGSDYRSAPELEAIFTGLFEGHLISSDMGIPWEVLATKYPQRYIDRNINALAFDTEVISDYLFYERGWDTTSANAEELEDQKDLLFTVLPLGNLRFFSSSNFALSGGINLSNVRNRTSTSSSQEQEIYPYYPNFLDEAD